jgi:TetR/AcrR family transcriptional repressor of nem operon
MSKVKILDTKNNIIKVAFSLFLKKGFKAVTINNIQERTGLSKGAIYHHFKNKEEIYFTTLETYYFKMLQTSNFYRETDVFPDQVKSLYTFAAELFHSIEHISENDSDYPIRNYFSLQLESEINDEVRKKTISGLSAYRNTVKQIVASGFEKKQIKENLDISSVSLQIIGLIEGVAIHHSTIKTNVKVQILEKYELVFNSYLKLICIDL